MRKLATVQKIKDLLPIKGADKIELATLQNKTWKVVVAKGLHKINDTIVYCEIDSLLPVRPEFEFLRLSSYTTEYGGEGFRLRTVKLRNQVSQGLILPLNILPIDTVNLSIGQDVTEMLGIRLAEKEIDMSAIDLIKAAFPADVPKTEMERIQNVPDFVEEHAGEEFIVTEKLDGDSTTPFLKPISDDNSKLRFGICAKTVEMIVDEKNFYGRYAIENKLEEKFRSLNEICVLQGEYLPKQGYYDLPESGIYFFRKIDPLNYSACSWEELKATTEKLGLQMVPIISENYILPNTAEELLKEANGMSVLNPKRKREGIVLTLKSDPNVWIKVISDEDLLNKK